MKAALHLYLERKNGSIGNAHVDIEINAATGEKRSVATADIELGENVEHIFDVSGVVADWIRDKKNHAEFFISIYKDAASKSSDPILCDQWQFYNNTNTDTNTDTEPQLVVHSYDTELEKIDYKRILDGLNSTENVIKRSASSTSDTMQRRRRQTKINNHCGRYSLNITNHEISTVKGETVLVPFSYDAGICGGGCGQSLPVDQEIRHNLLVHMLQSSDDFRNRHGYNITRVCTPIKYQGLDVIVSPPESSGSKAPFIRIIPNMRITQCECLEIVDFAFDAQSTTN